MRQGKPAAWRRTAVYEKSTAFKRSVRLIKDLKTLLLNLRSKDRDYQYKRLYRFFLNEKYYPGNKPDPDLLKKEQYQPNHSDGVEDLLSSILEAVYKDTLSGSIPQALKASEDFSGTVCCLDLTSLIESMNKGILDSILREKIRDERMIRLVNKFFGLIKFKRDRYSKTLSGDGLSELILDIYLTPVDRWLEENNVHAIRYHEKLIIEEKSCEGNKLVQFIKDRYAKEVLLVKKIRGQKLKFLGYEIKLVEPGKNILRIPQKAVKNFIIEKKLVYNIDQIPWKPIHRGSLLNLTDIEIIQIYNRELSSFYNYYRFAQNVSRKCGQLKYIMETSCLKTYARKYRTSTKKIREKFEKNNSWSVEGTAFRKGFRKQALP